MFNQPPEDLWRAFVRWALELDPLVFSLAWVCSWSMALIRGMHVWAFMVMLFLAFVDAIRSGKIR